jgi:hypothetical protein
MLVIFWVYRISVEIYYCNQSQRDFIIIPGTVNERTVSVICCGGKDRP